jgi:glycosyltransferase involved in cell wall biosynthesis
MPILQRFFSGTAPKVSIITPSYNHAEFIEETLDSVANQNYPNIEHIVVDGGSNDGTIDILEKRKRDERLTYVSEPDQGQSDAINKGIRLATGEIVAWLNSDDYYISPDVVLSVSKFFQRNPQADVVYGRGNFVDNDGNILREAYVHKDDQNLLFSFAWAVGILQPAVFFRKSVFNKVGYLDVENHTCMDYEFWVRLTHRGVKMHFLNKKLAQARYHEDMKSARARGKQLQGIIDVVYKYYGFAHPRWINVYAKYMVTNNVQIIHANSELDKLPDVQQKIEAIEQEMFRKYNSIPNAMEALMNPAFCDPAIAKQSLDKFIPDWQSILKEKV